MTGEIYGRGRGQFKELNMKRIVIGALLLIPVIAGCQQGETYFYHPDKTVEQAKVDCETCHEALLRATVGGTATVYTDESRNPQPGG